jgi:hypothetical protein
VRSSRRRSAGARKRDRSPGRRARPPPRTTCCGFRSSGCACLCTEISPFGLAAEAILPDWVQRIALAFAGGALVAAAVLCLAPDTAIDIWPWNLTSLTARVIGSLTARHGAPGGISGG